MKLLMPLPDEILNSWHGYLHTKVAVHGKAKMYFEALKGLLQRVKAGRKFSDLSASEKEALAAVVEKIAETTETPL